MRKTKSGAVVLVLAVLSVALTFGFLFAQGKSFGARDALAPSPPPDSAWAPGQEVGSLTDIPTTSAGPAPKAAGGTSTTQASNAKTDSEASSSVVRENGVVTVTLTETEFAIKPDQIEVFQGEKVRLVIENEGTIVHDMAIPDLGLKTGNIQNGNQSKLEFKADKAGTFTFFCSVPGHQQLGMKGEIVVKPVSAKPAAEAVSKPESKSKTTAKTQTVDGFVNVTLVEKEFGIEPSRIEVNLGDKVRIVVENHGTIVHDLTIPDLNLASGNIKNSGKSVLEFTAKKTGSFKVICSIPGHEQLGMKGELVVK